MDLTDLCIVFEPVSEVRDKEMQIQTVYDKELKIYCFGKIVEN
jgi:hypothetical protein